jgi:hypothetical protein
MASALSAFQQADFRAECLTKLRVRTRHQNHKLSFGENSVTPWPSPRIHPSFINVLTQ